MAAHFLPWHYGLSSICWNMALNEAESTGMTNKLVPHSICCQIVLFCRHCSSRTVCGAASHSFNDSVWGSITFLQWHYVALILGLSQSSTTLSRLRRKLPICKHGRLRQCKALISWYWGKDPGHHLQDSIGALPWIGSIESDSDWDVTFVEWAFSKL